MSETPDYELEYGCVRCQKYHGQSDGPIYQDHIMAQSKHGTRRRPYGGWLRTRDDGWNYRADVIEPEPVPSPAVPEEG